MNKIKIFSLISILFISGNIVKKIDPPLPFSVPDENIRPLRQLLNKDLQSSLEKVLKRNEHWKDLIKQKRLAVGLVDLRDPHKVNFARVNGDEMMYAASLPKLAILLTGTQALEDGILEATPAVLEDLKEMISKSDNGAATRMIDRLGYKKIESVLKDPRYKFYDENRGGGLWVGKRYAKAGSKNPDPLLGLSHAATVTQVCRFYYLLAFGKLVSFDRSVQMLDILADPELHHKFVNTVEKVAPDAKMYRKSGTWRNYHSDSILVWGKQWRRYILVALVEDENGEKILREIVPAVEEALREKRR